MNRWLLLAKKWILPLVLVVVLGVLIVWRLAQNRAQAAGQAQQRQAMLKRPPNVGVATVQVRDIIHTYDGVGTVQAPIDAKLSSKVTGRILYLQAQPGDAVRTGEVVGRVDPSQVEAQVQQQQAAVSSAMANYNQVSGNYASQVAAAMAAVTDAQGKVDSASAAIANQRAAVVSAQANLENANAQFNRAHMLFQQGYIAAQDMDTAYTQSRVQASLVNVARAQLNSALAAYQSALAQKQAAQHQADIARTKGQTDIQASRGQVAQARALLANVQSQYADTEIRSPVNGFVTARNMDPGMVATPGATVLEVGYIQQVWVWVPVPEEQTRHLTVGMSATAALDALPGRTFVGKITQIPPAADPQTRQFPVRVTLDNPQGLMKPGMFARVTVITQRVRNAIVVPPEAVQKGKGPAVVLVVDAKNIVHRLPVKTGSSDANGVAILQGVEPGERVVVLTERPPKDGQEVRIGGGRPGGGTGGQGGGSEGQAGGSGDRSGAGGNGNQPGAGGGGNQAGEGGPGQGGSQQGGSGHDGRGEGTPGSGPQSQGQRA